jgi:crotonobetainyl-CoA:carnitine CoA-transferase CaiB-like acyl-CoA transferase
MLADFGADVIKVESPAGAFERTFSSMDAFENGISKYHLSVNRNQRSLVVDLKSPEGREIIRRLLPRTDVIIQNFRPGVMAKYGLSYEDLKDEYPRLVYCEVSGYGSDGPYRDKPGQDILAQAKSGLATVSGRSDQPPVAMGTSIVDCHGASLAALGIVTALFDRERTGKGHKVDSCLLNAAMHMQIEAFGAYLTKGHLMDKLDTGAVTRIYDVPYGVYKAADGYIIISKVQIPKLRKVFGNEHFEGIGDGDVFNKRSEIDAIVCREVQKYTVDEMVEKIESVDGWCSRISEFSDVVSDPQVIHNKMIIEMDHPVAGKVRVLNNPLRFDGEGARIRQLPPGLGEHTSDIMRELGFSSDEVASVLEKTGLAGDGSK